MYPRSAQYQIEEIVFAGSPFEGSAVCSGDKENNEYFFGSSDPAAENKQCVWNAAAL
jgi:hypothetical protein